MERMLEGSRRPTEAERQRQREALAVTMQREGGGVTNVLLRS